MKPHPFDGLGKGINHDIQRRVVKGQEIHDQGLVLVDVLVALQHGPDVRHNLSHATDIHVAYTNGFRDTAVVHARGVFYGNGRKGSIRHVERALVKGANRSQPPADVLHHALDITIGGANPVADLEWPVQMDNEPTKEVGQQILGGKAHSDTTNTTKGQHPGYAVTKGLHGNQYRGDDNNGPGQLAHRIDRGVIHRLFHLQRRSENLFPLFDQPKQRPDQQENKANLQNGLID